MGIGLQGPAPKSAESRVRRHQDVLTPTRVIVPDGKVRGPELPPNVAWCDRTRIWWDTWRRSPQAQLMEESDWEVMLQAAIIHNDIWGFNYAKAGELTALTKEFSRITSAYGLTYLDRLKLRIKIEDEVTGENARTPEDRGEVPSNVTSIYKRMLGAA